MTELMTEVEQFLEPISGGNPAGQNLRYSLHAQIKEARRFEETGPMGLWEREVKVADFREVIRLAEDALIQSTKDLWIAAWLTDAWVYERGVPGLTSGLQLLCGLLERFWDGLYPQPDDGDLEERAVPLDWIGSYFDPAKGSSPLAALRRIPLSQNGYDWFAYQESRIIGYENEPRGADARSKREAAIKEGKLAPELFDKDFEATPKQLYADLEHDIKIALPALEELNKVCVNRFGNAVPSLAPLRDALKEFANLVHILHARKHEKDRPATPPASSNPPQPSKPDDKQEIRSVPDLPFRLSEAAPPSFPVDSEEIGGLEQAGAQIIRAAHFIQQATPSSPVSYLLLRALRWGETRHAGTKALADLRAPSSETRVALRSAAEKKHWNEVLHTAEAAMSTPAGRGWLDLQRYSIKACDELGYVEAAKALRSELKTYLQDFPQLSSALLSDDTGAANPETLTWLRQEALIA